MSSPGLDGEPRDGAPPMAPEVVTRVPLPSGWRALEKEPLPRPTAWPAALAFAVTFLLWGIISSPFITGVGALLFVFSLAGWIGDIRHEARSHH